MTNACYCRRLTNCSKLASSLKETRYVLNEFNSKVGINTQQQMIMLSNPDLLKCLCSGERTRQACPPRGILFSSYMRLPDMNFFSQRSLLGCCQREFIHVKYDSDGECFYRNSKFLDWVHPDPFQDHIIRM